MAHRVTKIGCPTNPKMRRAIVTCMLAMWTRPCLARMTPFFTSSLTMVVMNQLPSNNTSTDVAVAKEAAPSPSPVILQPLNCEQMAPVSLMDELPDKTEPSDLVYHPQRNLLYVVSDNGKLLGLTVDGHMKEKYKLDGKPDLEGIAFVPSRPDFLYLGQEYPATIMEFNLQTGTVERSWDVQPVLDANKKSASSQNASENEEDEAASDQNKGLEGLTFLPNKTSPFLGTFLVGRQSDARIFVFQIPLLETKAVTMPVFVGMIQPPGPGYDLSALTIWRNRLWVLYDKGKTLKALDVTQADISTIQGDPVFVDLSLSMLESLGTMSFDIRGQEGLAFVDSPEGGWAFVAVDAPHKTGRKDLLKYSLAHFFGCHSSLGIKAVPSR